MKLTLWNVLMAISAALIVCGVIVFAVTGSALGVVLAGFGQMFALAALATQRRRP